MACKTWMKKSWKFQVFDCVAAPLPLSGSKKPLWHWKLRSSTRAALPSMHPFQRCHRQLQHRKLSTQCFLPRLWFRSRPARLLLALLSLRRRYCKSNGEKRRSVRREMLLRSRRCPSRKRLWRQRTRPSPRSLRQRPKSSPSHKSTRLAMERRVQQQRRSPHPQRQRPRTGEVEQIV